MAARVGPPSIMPGENVPAHPRIRTIRMRNSSPPIPVLYNRRNGRTRVGAERAIQLSDSVSEGQVGDGAKWG